MSHSGNQMINPELLFEKAHLQPGMHIADFGCGRTGHVVFPAAKFLGDSGLVYAVDIMKDILENIRKQAITEGFYNVQTVWADLERFGMTAIPSKNLDVGFVINMLFQSNDQHAVLREVSRTLKDKSRLVVVDWAQKGLPFGPSEDRFIDFIDIENWGHENGFVTQEGFLMGPYHQGLVMFKHD